MPGTLGLVSQCLERMSLDGRPHTQPGALSSMSEAGSELGGNMVGEGHHLGPPTGLSEPGVDPGEQPGQIRKDAVFRYSSLKSIEESQSGKTEPMLGGATAATSARESNPANEQDIECITEHMKSTCMCGDRLNQEVRGVQETGGLENEEDMKRDEDTHGEKAAGNSSEKDQGARKDEKEESQSLAATQERGHPSNVGMTVRGRGGKEEEAALFPVPSSEEDQPGLKESISGTFHPSQSDSALFSSSSSTSESSPPLSRSQSVSSCRRKEFYDLLLIYSDKDEDACVAEFRQYASQKQWKTISVAEFPIGKLNLIKFCEVMEDCSYAVLLISKNFMEDKKCLRHYHIALDYSDMNDDFAECVLPILFGDLNLTADLGSITHVRWGSRYFEGVMARSISSNKRVEKERQSSSSGPPPFSQTPRTLSLNVQSGMSWSQAPIQSSIQVTDQSRRVSQTALRKPEQEACLMPSEVDSPSLPPIPAPTVASGGAVCATGGAQTTTTCHRESMQGQASWASDSPPSVQCDQGSLASGPSQAPCPQSAADIFLELDVSSQPSERSAAILSHGRFAELCNLLDPTHPTGSDWTMLAEILDLKKSQIGVLNEKRGGQTKMLLEIFFRLHEGEERLAILEKLQDTLEIMDRNDAEDVIKKEIKILKCRNLKCKKR